MSKISNRWTIQEEILLKQVYPLEGSQGVLTYLPYKTSESIRHKASRLHVSLVESWTNEEVRILRRIYSTEGAARVRVLLPHRTLTSIHHKARTEQIPGLMGQSSGERHPYWKGGITDLSMSIRKSTVYKEWQKTILTRDNFTCQYSGQYGGNLQIHHIHPFSRIIEENTVTTIEDALVCVELWDWDNVITLNEKWHSGIQANNPLAFHRLYGTRSCTKENFNQWLKILMKGK